MSRLGRVFAIASIGEALTWSGLRVARDPAVLDQATDPDDDVTTERVRAAMDDADGDTDAMMTAVSSGIRRTDRGGVAKRLSVAQRGARRSR